MRWTLDGIHTVGPSTWANITISTNKGETVLVTQVLLPEDSDERAVITAIEDRVAEVEAEQRRSARSPFAAMVGRSGETKGRAGRPPKSKA